MGNTNIKEAISKSLAERFGGQANDTQYRQAIEVVAADLQAVLDSAVEALRNGGTALGASEEDVNNLLIEAGLITEDEPVAASSESEAPAWAKQYMEKVDKLVDLARTRLGASI